MQLRPRKRARHATAEQSCLPQDSESSSPQVEGQDLDAVPVAPELQVQHQFLLQLGTMHLPVQRKRVPGLQPALSFLSDWYKQDPVQFEVRLIGNAAEPSLFACIRETELQAYSLWGAAHSRLTEMQNGGVTAIVPVRTSQTVVHKLAEAFYSGFIELGDDVEELLVLANSMQVIFCHALSDICLVHQQQQQ